MIRLLLFVLLVFSSFPTLSQKIDKQILNGLEKYYNFNWKDGNKIFNKIITENPDDPRAYHYKSVPYLWFYLGSFNEAYLDTFEFFTDKSINLTNKKINAEKVKSIEQAYILGAIYYNKSVASARSNDYVNAIYSSNRMHEELSYVVETDSAYYDAYLGIGLYNFALAQLPSSFQWAVGLVGVKGDKEEGLKNVITASEKGTLAKIDAKFYLSQLFSRLVIDLDEADKILSGLVKSYPKNLLFNFSKAWLCYEKNDLANTEKYLKPIFSSKDTMFPFIRSNSELLMGNVLFNKEMYDSAQFYYRSFLDNAVNNEYQGFGWLRLGMSKELSGDRKSAIECYENTSEGSSDIDDDIYAKRLGSNFFEKPISANKNSLIHFANLIKQRKFKQAKDTLKSFLKLSKLSSDQKAEAYLYFSEVNYYLKEFKSSVENSVKAIEHKPENENWIHAFAAYYAALSSFELKEYVDCNLFLKQIDDLDDYDFQNLIENKSFSLKRKLSKVISE